MGTFSFGGSLLDEKSLYSHSGTARLKLVVKELQLQSALVVVRSGECPAESRVMLGKSGVSIRI